MPALDFPANPTNGQYYQGYVWNATNGAWDSSYQADTLKPGLTQIIAPTVSVSGGTATANTLGTLTFTGATSFSLNNIFSAGYENYFMTCTITGASTNAGVFMRLRKAGVDNSATLYRHGGLAADWNGTLSGASSGTGSTDKIYPIATTSQGYTQGFSLNFFHPFVSARTRYSYQGNADNGSTIWGAVGAGYHNNVESYDGFTIYPSAGNLSGIITVYGYAL